MREFFNLNLEFDHNEIYYQIEKIIDNNQKGYVCVVDANVLTMAQKNMNYRSIINNSTFNSCDGSSIAVMAGHIYKRKYRALNGPEIFSKLIEKKHRHILLGGVEETSNKIKELIKLKNGDNSNIFIMPLPFNSVNDFDYNNISKKINEINPDLIWVSLGAPKQEVFMSILLPYLDKGLMFGIGAAFNFYTGNLEIPTIKIGGLKFIWLDRLIKEPKKLFSRLLSYLLIIPKLYYDENKRSKITKVSHFH